MADSLVVLDGSSFLVLEPGGDVEPGPDANGYFFADMRHLAVWRLVVDGERPKLLSSRAVDYYSASIHCTLARARVGKNPTVSIRRDRFISDGVHEDLTVENHSPEPVNVQLELRFGTDFADLFEVKEPRPKRGTQTVKVGVGRVTLSYQRDGFSRATVLTFGGECTLTEETARFEVVLQPRSRRQTCVEITAVADGKEHGPGHACGAFGKPRPKMPLSALAQKFGDVFSRGLE